MAQAVDEGTLVMLDASGTQDDFGDITAYAWRQIAGTGVSLSGADTVVASFIAPTRTVPQGPETLTFELTVTDRDGAQSSDTFSVSVQPVNALPQVDAGSDQDVPEQTPVTLTGRAHDTDGHVAELRWMQVAGKDVELHGPETEQTQFTAPVVVAPEILEFRLVATDDETETGSDGVQVLVLPVNADPRADAGSDQEVRDGAPVALQGAGTDEDGSIVAFRWTQIDGIEVQMEDADAAEARFMAPLRTLQEGQTSLSFRLEVTDNEGALASDDVLITVEPFNEPPESRAGRDRVVNIGDTVVLDGTDSFDPDGVIDRYRWRQPGGPEVSLSGRNTAVANFVAQDVTERTVLRFRLRVFDNEGSRDDDFVDISINAPPVADAGPDQDVEQQTTVTLDARDSSDSDGNVASYRWTQTGGPSVSIANRNAATTTFTAPARTVQQGPVDLTFSVLVTDNDGASDEDSVRVTVQPPNQDPNADAGPDQNVDEQTTVTLDATGSSDSDGNITDYQWTQTRGPSVNLSDDDEALASFTAPTRSVQQGSVDLRFRVRVTDDDGATDTDTVEITVRPVNASPSANAGADKTAASGASVSLTGAGSDPDGSVVAFLWEQVGGPGVSLQGQNSSTASFTAPTVAAATDLTFRLTVTDNENATDTDNVQVTVLPPPGGAGATPPEGTLKAPDTPTGLSAGAPFEVAVTATASPPAIAMDADGDFAVAWVDGNRILWRSYTSDGQPSTQPSIVSASPEAPVKLELAMDALGNSAVVWERQTRDQHTVWGQRVGQGGELSGPAFRVGGTASVYLLDAAMDASGNLVVLWRGDPQTHRESTLNAERHYADGRVQVIRTAAGPAGASDRAGSLALDPHGNLTIASATTGSEGVLIERYSARGVTLGVATPAGDSRDPIAGAGINGDTAVLWREDDNTYARLLEAGAATSSHSDFIIETHAIQERWLHPVVGVEGQLTVVRQTPDGGLAARRFDRQGVALGGWMQFEHRRGDVRFATLTARADGELLAAAWISPATDGTYAVKAQRLVGSRNVDLVLVLRDDRDPAQVAVPFGYTLLVTNAHPPSAMTGMPALDAAVGAATGVSVSATLPTGLEVQDVQGTDWSCTGADTQISCRHRGALPASGVATVTVTALPQVSGSLAAAATVEADQRDTDRENGQDMEFTTVLEASDVTQSTAPQAATATSPIGPLALALAVLALRLRPRRSP